MTPPPEHEYLFDILDAANLVASFTDGYTRQRFLDDSLVQSAVIWQLQIVGEAVRNLPDSYCASHPSVAWRDMVSMRNLLVHAYKSIDLEIVGTVIEKYLPEAARQIEQIVRVEGSDPGQ